MKCDICGSRDSYVKMHNHNYNGIKFKSKRRFCKNCNNLVYDSKLDNIASMKTTKIKKNIIFTPTEYNGYSILSKKKIYNVILYLSNESILKTKLLKEMFYIDFLYYKNNCKSLTGLEYAKLPYGPVPDQFEEIINTCSKENIINYEVIFENNYECHNIKANKKFNKNIFNKEELEIMELVKNNFKKYSSKDIVEYSHKEKAFKEPKYGDKISYDYAFDIESF